VIFSFRTFPVPHNQKNGVLSLPTCLFSVQDVESDLTHHVKGFSNPTGGRWGYLQRQAWQPCHRGRSGLRQQPPKLTSRAGTLWTDGLVGALPAHSNEGSQILGCEQLITGSYTPAATLSGDCLTPQICTSTCPSKTTLVCLWRIH
jgi:hypothetical protein